MIGLILASYNDIKYLPSCLENWIKYRETNPLLICCLDVCFAENGSGNSTDGSIELLTKYKEENKIDFFQILPPGLKEHEARNVGLKFLLEQNCEAIVSIGTDEKFLLKEICQIFNYVKKEEFIAIFKIHYKNYVGDEKHYVNGFTPSRIWRVNYQDKKIKECFWDDDLKYINKEGVEIIDKNLPSKIIPNIQIKHLTWLNDERSKRKIAYQNLHFKPYGCGYKWNEKTQSVELNIEHYKNTGQTPPEIYEEALKE